jgi:hypothetical protein
MRAMYNYKSISFKNLKEKLMVNQEIKKRKEAQPRFIEVSLTQNKLQFFKIIRIISHLCSIFIHNLYL